MNSNKILIFFIAIAIFFWNPVSFYLLYVNTPVYDSFAVKISFWAVPLISLVIIYLIRRNSINNLFKNLVFTFSFSTVLFALIVVFNFILGFLMADKDVDKNNSSIPIKKGFIFEPNTTAHYQTVEFDYVANINSYGLRDREINIDKGDKFRILCFGDSWTFGWGVNAQNSWPNQLEKFFHDKEIKNVEVINCGQGGQYTSTYKKYMEKTVPLFKPDLVLVGVLQLDDLAQLYENNFHLSNINSVTPNQQQKPIWTKSNNVFKLFLESSTHHILSKVRNLKKSKTIEVKSNLVTSSQNIVNSFSRLQKLRFYSLDDSVQNLFMTGNLNPSLLDYYINFSDRLAIFNNPDHKATLFSIDEMKKDFKDMTEICSANKAQLVFLNMPLNNFTGHIVVRTPSDVLNNYYKENNKIDSIYQSVASEYNLTYIELTDHFIDLADKEKYFFKYDGHPNEKGYEEIAKYIGNKLIDNKILKKD